MAPKEKKWYKHIYTHGTSNAQWDSLEQAIRAGGAIAIIEYIKVSESISVSIVHHYNDKTD